MAVNPEYIRLNRYKYPRQQWVFDSKKRELESKVGVEPHFAYDISHNVMTKGDVFDEKAINESLTLLLLTMKGELIFRPDVGTSLPTVPFENMTSTNNNAIIGTVLEEIEAIERRIAFIKSDCNVFIYPDENTIDLNLKYYILKTGEIGEYQQKIST